LGLFGNAVLKRMFGIIRKERRSEERREVRK
jgi:hypothetical protein